MNAERRKSITPETIVFLVATAVAIMLTITGLLINEHSLVVVLALSVAFAGIPHGALDVWVGYRAALWRTWRGAIAFHLGYLAAVGAVIVTWHVLPGVSLALFLACSGWHFADDWRLPTMQRIAVGAAMLALPAWIWPDEVLRIFKVLSGESGAVIAHALETAGPALGVAMSICVLILLRRSLVSGVELIVMAGLAVLLPPLIYFGVYFCALHSPRHFRLTAAQSSQLSRSRLIAITALYTCLTLVGAVMAWTWLASADATQLSNNTLSVIFIGLAALTVPHMCVIAAAEKTMKTSVNSKMRLFADISV